MAKLKNKADKIISAETGPPESLVKALVAIFRPLVKLFIRYQINHGYVSQLLKSIYVNVAENDFKVSSVEQTDSRISMLTGIHRREVKRLRTPIEDGLVMPGNVSVGTQILTAWITDSRFSHKGEPKKLPKSTKGDNIGFDTLVSSISKQDLRTKVVLEEWLHLGLVQIDNEGLIELRTEAFVTETGFDEKAFFFGKNLYAHIAAGAHNLAGGQPPQFDRSVFYNHLTEDSVATISTLIEKQGMETLKIVNAKSNELQKKDRGNKAATGRINFGSYFWVEEECRGNDDV